MKTEQTVYVDEELIEKGLETRQKLRDDVDDNENISAMVSEALKYYVNANPGEISLAILAEDIQYMVEKHREEYLGEGLLNKWLKDKLNFDGGEEG